MLTGLESNIKEHYFENDLFFENFYNWVLSFKGQLIEGDT